MTIVRREHRAHFTIVPNAMFLDERLSIEAKGVLGFLLSRPHKWQVRLDHVGRTLRIGRKKLQRIFRELITAGYVTREQQRILDGHRFGEMDYVVRDVPEPLSHPVDSSPIPRGQNGTAAPRVQKGPAYKETPQGQKGPAYKELLHKNGIYGSSSLLDAEGWPHFPVAEQQLPSSLEHAHYDAEIIALFDDAAEGWELLSVIPSETLAQLRERQRCGDLDRFAITELRIRYHHLLAGGGRTRPPKSS
ncbi:MAG: hypothetical protein L0Y60_17410 [Beijerinckiaceae bacterium]|nr:hypothetical protein [Beijerinckiaceae bacterium]